MTRPGQTHRALVLAAVLASMFTIAVEATIVSTAMPQIAGELGQLHLYSWAFSAFLLSQTATAVVFGKLADIYGRKTVMLCGLGIFMLGSLLCGFAWSMPALIAFRLIQGIGAGAIQPVSLTIVGDMYPPHERGRVQGYISSVWGVSSVLGPLAGGLIVAHLNWGWIFWLNLPVCLASAAGFLLFLHEDVVRRAQSIDVAGAVLFAIAATAVLVAFTEFGTGDRAGALAAFGVFLVGIASFVRQERRARDPMLHFGLWSRRPIATANAATVLSSMVAMSLTTFLPMYVQGVLGRSALVAGFALTVMVLAWPIGALIAARTFVRHGLRNTLRAGGVMLPIGAAVLLTLGPGSLPAVAGLGAVVVGFGMGFMNTSATVIVQSCVGWAERGSATASFVFSRNLGSTLGATVLGGVLNLSLAGHGGVALDDVRALLDRSGGSAAVQLALGQSLHVTFWGVFAVAVLALVSAMQVPPVSLAQAPDDAEKARLDESQVNQEPSPGA